MPDDPKEIIKAMKAGSPNLSIQVGRDGEIIGEPTGYISTQNPMLDWLIGKPGFPLGGISLLVGAFGTGKSTIVLKALAECQAKGGVGIMVDTEGRLNYDRAEKLGVNMDTLLVAQPDTLEQMFDGVKEMIAKAREVVDMVDSILIAVDSIAGAPLEKEVTGEKHQLGLQSLTVRREMRILSNLVNRQRIGLLLTTQPRQKINLGKWGAPEPHWLGRDPIGHAAMTTILLEEKKKFGGDDVANSPLGNVIQATLVDTRIAGCTLPECRECRRKGFRREFDFYAATGPDFFGSALDVLTEAKAVDYNGGWYSFEGKKFRRDDLEAKMEEWPGLLEALSRILAGGHHENT
jgi:recombination protein RecA